MLARDEERWTKQQLQALGTKLKPYLSVLEAPCEEVASTLQDLLATSGPDVKSISALLEEFAMRQVPAQLGLDPSALTEEEKARLNRLCDLCAQRIAELWQAVLTLHGLKAKLQGPQGSPETAQQFEQSRAHVKEALERILKTLEEHVLDLPPTTSLRRAPVVNGLLTTLSNQVYHELRRALALGGFSKNVEGWPSEPIMGDGYCALAQLRPSPREPIPDEALESYQQRMWALRKRLSDLDADVLDGVTAIWLENARYKDEMVAVTADDLLRLRGIKPKPGGRGRGGYTDEQREAIVRSVENLAAIWLNVQEATIVRETTDRRGRVHKVQESWAIQSPALVASSRLMQKTSRGSGKIYAWRVRPGDFFTPYLLGPGRQTALLSQKALAFDPYRQTWEKRLTRYFAYQWRVRARAGTYMQPFRVTTLLEQCEPTSDYKRPWRLKEHLEKALDNLEEAKVISSWSYQRAQGSGTYTDPATGEKLPNYEAQKSRDWLNWTVLVEPPPEIVQHYQELSTGKTRSIPASVSSAELGDQIRRWRQREGLSQREAAKFLGITQAYLSDIEKGKKQPSSQLAAKLKAAIDERN